MNALLGKITSITPLDADAAGQQRLQVRFSPSCLLPARGKIPEWLKEQTLTVERRVPDAREVGYPGDSIVLSPEESATWLQPFVVTPALTYGAVPATLGVRLRWWKEEKAPDCTARANGRQVTVKLEKDDAGFAATIATAELFGEMAVLPPVEIAVTCDKFKATCVVLPTAYPFARRLATPPEVYRAENAWFALDIGLQDGGGGIRGLREQGRGRDYFQPPAGVVQIPYDLAGHVDRYINDWRPADKLREVTLTSAGAQRESDGLVLYGNAVVDEGQHLHTTVSYTVYDRLPLIAWTREFHFQAGAKKDDKPGEDKPKDTIDDIKQLGVGFRAAWAADDDGATGSRVLTSDGTRLLILRCGLPNEMMWQDWTLADGWALVEHPHRREYLLYLFDRLRPPRFASYRGASFLTLEPSWTMRPVRVGEAIGLRLALSAGELAGASADGVWVACRAARPEGGVTLGVVARLKTAPAAAVADLTVGGVRQEVALETLPLPGIGVLAAATAVFPAGQMDDPTTGTVAGIADRR